MNSENLRWRGKFVQQFLKSNANSQGLRGGTLLLLLIVLTASNCRRQSTLTLPTPASQPMNTTVGVRTSYADVVKRVAPAVVTIRTQVRVRAPQQYPFMDDPFFRRFFGERMQQVPEQRATGLGSGVIITGDGYILTNHHVVDGAQDIKVDLQGQQSLNAKIIGSDPPSDLAVLKIDASGLSPLALADSDKVQVGDVVLAIGNPLGVGQTVTMGIISAKGRQTGLSNGSFEDFLQTDAPINRGNSGGALVDTSGDLIGINSQILSPSGGSIGIGFAIPSNMARSVLEQLIKNGKVRRGHLGIVVQPLTRDMSTNLGLKEAKGVIVSQVQAGSAAEGAGIKPGDVIVGLDGKEVIDPNTFRNDIARLSPGTTTTLKIVRNGNEQDIRVTLGEFVAENTKPSSDDNSGNENSEGGKLGITIQPLTPDLARQLGLNSDVQGVVITSIDPTGPAADANIERGDVIVQVNQQPVRTATDVRSAIERSRGGPVLLLVNHRGTTVFVTVMPRN